MSTTPALAKPAPLDALKFECFKIMARHGFSGELNPVVHEMVKLVHEHGWARGVLDATRALVDAYPNRSFVP